jgi:hypothetical protein
VASTLAILGLGTVGLAVSIAVVLVVGFMELGAPVPVIAIATVACFFGLWFVSCGPPSPPVATIVRGWSQCRRRPRSLDNSRTPAVASPPIVAVRCLATHTCTLRECAFESKDPCAPQSPETGW